MTEWPTIPQIFVRGQFIGGCDILEEMHGDGSLQKLVQDIPPN
jgi:monothiol glutaredoxin